ncbi:unnamed protein product [Symbiodinium sp. CCMP2592]|nr:unnamed protein product [Symbiodinium sp. CCMP2592]
MEQVILKAESLHETSVRQLTDLFYNSPEELPWTRTECVIDVVQTVAYLDQAVVFLYKSISYKGLRCPDDLPSGCAASVAGFITSLSWIASYIASSANACGHAVNSGALCAADFASLVADFGEIASASAAVRADCSQNTTSTLTRARAWKQFLPAGAGPEVLKGSRDAKRDEGFDIAQCVSDVSNSAAYIVRAILQIRTAAVDCPDPKACAIDIMNVISSFAWVAQFTALAVSDCDLGANQALCSADISDMLAAVTSGPASGIATSSDCADRRVATPVL